MDSSLRSQELEAGRRYRFTLRTLAGRNRVIEAVLGAAFWGEVPLVTAKGVIRVDRSDVLGVQPVY